MDPQSGRAAAMKNEEEHPSSPGPERGSEEEGRPKRVPVLITVCDRCMRACCWQGVFFCDNYMGAGTVEITRAKAKALGLEHPDYWRAR